MNRPSSRATDRAAPIVAILAIAIMAAVSLKSLWPPTAHGGGQSPGIENPAAARLGPDAMYARSWVAGTTLVRRSYAF
jgi:hypothetical protein